MLIGVHVLIAAHFVHWRLAGRTLAPLELNEVMHTLELGIVTAGFVFMALALTSVFIFGRFFCSWGCHILALQDLSHWMLGRFGVRAKPVRSRALVPVAAAAMLYMFVWPQVRRIALGEPTPRLHVAGAGERWASFVTDDFWRNLPPPGMALLTFFIVGFLAVYVLGSRSFCLYGCPYGAAFALADRFAPGRIKLAHPADCTSCGKCTAVCESHVRVHEEVGRYGSVIDAACLKDLDCVNVCPTGALSYGLTRPSLGRSIRPLRRRLPSDFSWPEEVLIGAAFVASLLIFRGLYGAVPFLLTLAMGAILGYAAVLGVRTLGRANVRFNQFVLRRAGRVTRSGGVFLVLSVALWSFVAHSGVMRWHEVHARRSIQTAAQLAGADPARVGRLASDASRSLEIVERWGIALAPDHHRMMASALWGSGRGLEAERRWSLAAKRDPRDLESAMFLIHSLLERDAIADARPLLMSASTAEARHARDEDRYALHRDEAWGLLLATCQLAVTEDGAKALLEHALAALRRSPNHPQAHALAGTALYELGRVRDAAPHLERARELMSRPPATGHDARSEESHRDVTAP